MKHSFKKYSLLGLVLVFAWLGYLGYVYVHYTSYDNDITNEIKDNSRRVGQQIFEIFSWFDAKKEVFITGPQETKSYLPGATATINGKNLTMAVPLELAHKLENEFANGIRVRFVSNTPKNADNFPKPVDNSAVISMAEDGMQDRFQYFDDLGKYHYVRAIFALSSCVTCHTNVQSGELIGAVVVETDPKMYVLNQRFEKANLFLYCLILASVIVVLLYLFLCRLWRKYSLQGDDLAASKSMLDTMGHEMEVLLGNVSRILHSLQQGGDTAQSGELLLALQAMNSELVNSAMKLTGNEVPGKSEGYEEVFHVETLLQQCLQLFYATCKEKKLHLQLDIDLGVPEYVLGDALHLRQVITRILKESVTHTHSGSVQVRVRAATDRPMQLDAKNLHQMPIHLLIEVEDTGKGYIITEEKGFMRSQDASFSSRPKLALKPLIDIAAFLNGNVTLTKNKADGAIFELLAQVKLVGDDTTTTSRAAKRSFNAEPVLEQVAHNLHKAQQGAQEVQQGLVQAQQDVPAVKNAPGMQQAERGAKRIDSSLNQAQADMKQARAELLASMEKKQADARAQRIANGTRKVGASSASALADQDEQGQQGQILGQMPSQAQGHVPEQDSPHQPVDAPVPLPGNPLIELDFKAPIIEEQPISIIIGDSGISQLTDKMKTIFAAEKIDVQLMSTADAIFKAVDTKDHTISVVLLRELQDLDVTYTATRIRYLEQLGSKPVAIVIISEDIVQGDMDVLRHFNISTMNEFPRDAAVASKVCRMVLRTQDNRIFHGNTFLAKTDFENIKHKLFDVKMAMENSQKDRTLIRNMCSMWVRFYPEQVKRLRQVIRDGNSSDVLRIVRSVKNSASTVGLPMLWDESHRIEKKLENNEETRFEKLFSVYEQTYEHLKKSLDWDDE